MSIAKLCSSSNSLFKLKDLQDVTLVRENFWPMDNYYKILGLVNTASAEEIRRAYRILARRYHPDVNPERSTVETFKKISLAYNTLRDPKKRRMYDAELEQSEKDSLRSKLKGYSQSKVKEYSKRAASTSSRSSSSTEKVSTKTSTSHKKPTKGPTIALSVDDVKKLVRKFSSILQSPTTKPLQDSTPTQKVGKISIIEVSLTLQDAVKGVRKTIEVFDGALPRKLSIRIPAGVRTGTVLRMRNKHNLEEELVLVIQVARHPFLRLERRGLVVELPITVREALFGASISVPTLDDPVILRIPQSSQSGQLIRLKGRGVRNRDGSAGDLYFQLLIQVPEHPDIPGLLEAADRIDVAYSNPVRTTLPRRLLIESSKGGSGEAEA